MILYLYGFSGSLISNPASDLRIQISVTWFRTLPEGRVTIGHQNLNFAILASRSQIFGTRGFSGSLSSNPASDLRFHISVICFRDSARGSSDHWAPKFELRHFSHIYKSGYAPIGANGKLYIAKYSLRYIIVEQKQFLEYMIISATLYRSLMTETNID